ncbi:MAG: alpha/beta fold hydrolase [Streptosporangiaceae bacterium]|nr:alpha/beta fold hydrolase [Streptosporangiaceae bacterium]
MSNVRLAATLDGPDGAPVVVLGNSLGTTREIWDAQASLLRSRFRLLRFELRGHGAAGARSPAPPRPYSIAELGADVLGLLGEYGIPSAAYCGISLGGMIGIWLAAHAPERVSSLVVCCTAITPMPSRQAWLDRVALVRSGGMAAISEMMPPRWFTPEFLAAEPAAVERAMDMLLGTDPEGYAGCGEAIAGMDLRPALAAVVAPTLVIAGAEDSAAPPWQAAQAAAGIAGSRLQVIRGTSHLAPYQTPGPVTAAILRHLGTP